jgi:hypothetical protein
MATRIEKYTYGINPKRIEEDLTYKKPDMITQETAYFARFEEIEAHVRGILSGEKVYPSDYPKYQAFAKELFHLQRKFGGGEGVIAEAGLLVVKWKARSCVEAVLDKVRNEVFGIPPPAAGPVP